MKKNISMYKYSNIIMSRSIRKVNIKFHLYSQKMRENMTWRWLCCVRNIKNNKIDKYIKELNIDG